MNNQKMLEEFEDWCAIKNDSDYREGAWDAWQARQEEIEELEAQLREQHQNQLDLLESLHRDHITWDRAHAVIEKLPVEPKEIYSPNTEVVNDY